MTRTGTSSRKVLIIVLSVVVVAVLAVAAVVFWPRSSTPTASPGVAGSAAPVPGTVVDPPVPAAATKIKPIAPGAGKTPTPAKVAARLAGPLSNPKVGQLTGIVLDPARDTILWKKDPGTPQLPASSLKLLTGTALLTSMDPNTRLTTRVVQGDQPGDIVFVGGGDVTLSAAATGVKSVYDGAPTVADLAQQIKASGVPVKRILTDTSYWSGDELANGWVSTDIAGGFITRMQSLMVDGDRSDPSSEVSKRTGTPALTAAKALARALGTPDLPIVGGTTAPAGARVLAKVQSQPVSILLAQALLNSDNVLAEALGRQVAIARGAPPTFDGVQASVTQALDDLKLDTGGLQLSDASGLSDQDKASPSLLADVVSLAVAGKVKNIQYLLSGLPVAGVSGTLADRFQDAASRAGAGWVRAKTGSVAVTYALVGYVPDVDGHIIVFAFNSNGVTAATRPAQDALAAALRQCGCS